MQDKGKDKQQFFLTPKLCVKKNILRKNAVRCVSVFSCQSIHILSKLVAFVVAVKTWALFSFRLDGSAEPANEILEQTAHERPLVAQTYSAAVAKGKI